MHSSHQEISSGVRIVHRRLAVLALALGACLGFTGAHAEDYPSRPLKMIVPYSTGGTADTLGRMMAQGMSEPLGQSIVVENRSGAGALIGASYVAKSAPDGYTLLLGAGSTHTTPQVMTKSMPYEPQADFEPVAMIGNTSYVLFANSNLPYRTLEDLIRYAKANPGKVSYGSTGQGTAVHLTMAHFANLAGIRLLHVPYRGGGQTLVDVMGGQIDLTLGTAESAPMVKSGKLRALAVMGPNKLSALPEVPTCIQAGVPKCEFPVWNAIFVPAKTPAAIIAKLSAAAQQFLALPTTQQRLRDLGYEPVADKPDQLKKRIADEIRLVNSIAAQAGVQPE